MAVFTQSPVAALPPALNTSEVKCGARASERGSLAFKLLLVFLAVLYSNLGQLVPAIEAVRPAQLAGGLAVLVLAVRRFGSRESFVLSWPQGHLLFGFVAAAGLSVFTAVWAPYALNAATSLVKMAVIYFVIANAVDTPSRLRIAMWAMVLGGLFPAIGALNYYRQGIVVESYRTTWVGIFANPNELAYSLVILVPMALALAGRLSLAGRAAIAALLGLYLVVIYLTFSRGGLLGLAAVAAMLGLHQRRVWARILVFAVLVAGAAGASYFWVRGEGFSGLGQDFTVRQRFATMKVGLAMFADRPLTGVGIDCSVVAWPLYAPAGEVYRQWLVVHNTFIQALSETGALGFIPFLGFLGFTLHRAWQLRRAGRGGEDDTGRLGGGLQIAFIGFLVCGLSGGYVLTWFPYLLAGLIAAAHHMHERDQVTVRTPALVVNKGVRLDGIGH